MGAPEIKKERRGERANIEASVDIVCYGRGVKKVGQEEKQEGKRRKGWREGKKGQKWNWASE